MLLVHVWQTRKDIGGYAYILRKECRISREKTVHAGMVMRVAWRSRSFWVRHPFLDMADTWPSHLGLLDVILSCLQHSFRQAHVERIIPDCFRMIDCDTRWCSRRIYRDTRWSRRIGRDTGETLVRSRSCSFEFCAHAGPPSILIMLIVSMNKFQIPVSRFQFPVLDSSF